LGNLSGFVLLIFGNLVSPDDTAAFLFSCYSVVSLFFLQIIFFTNEEAMEECTCSNQARKFWIIRWYLVAGNI
jgi:hypothetical protein